SAACVLARGRSGGSIAEVSGRAAVKEEISMHPFEAKTSEEWSLPREGAGELFLRTPAGNLRVIADESDQLQIRAAKQARAAQESSAQAFLALMKIERRRDGDRWLIEASWPEVKLHDVQSPHASFDVTL